jgi:hypothetical protein
MSENSLFTNNELKLFKFEIKSKFRAGIRTPVNILYIFMAIIGIGWASWAIPVINKGSITPETIGIYVISFLITVGLDALLIFKKIGDENKIGQTISILIMILSILLIILSSTLSLKSFPEENTIKPIGTWKCYAYFILPMVLTISILMSIVLKGFDNEELPVGPLDLPPSSLADRK